MFNPVLLNMQPRYIEAAINSIKESANFPRVFFRAYTEPQVIEEMNKFIKETNYSHYIIHGDDNILPKKTVDTILHYAQIGTTDVLTGWMNLKLERRWHKEGTIITNWDEYKLGEESTVCFGKIPPISEPHRGPYPDEYPLRETVASMSYKFKELLQVSMACFAFTCAPRKILINYPLSVHPNGYASDHQWSYRLQEGGIKIWTHPDAFVKHLKRYWALHRDWKWLTGHYTPETIYETDIKRDWKSREHDV